MFHYTDKTGFNGISSQKTWRFLALKPPAEHPIGAYFTTLEPGTRRLAARLRIPATKLEFLFSFNERAGELKPLDGGRGEYIFYSSSDYEVVEENQIFEGR